jgi:hypothetical protein
MFFFNFLILHKINLKGQRFEISRLFYLNLSFRDVLTIFRIEAELLTTLINEPKFILVFFFIRSKFHGRASLCKVPEQKAHENQSVI